MIRKNYRVAEFKALPDENGQTGRFEALVSVFGNVDLMGDRVVKGAFKESLERWRDSGDPIPVIWSHDWGNPFAHIGSADPAQVEETDDGLKLIGSLDVEEPFAGQVYRLLSERRVKEFSFAYDINGEREGDDGANELTKLDLIEAGPTLKGANPDTELLGVKSRLEKAAGKNFYEPLPGSDEDRRAAVQRAVDEWARTAYPTDSDDPDVWTFVSATFQDRVIVTVEKRGEDEQYFEFDYEMDGDGTAVLTSDPRAVDVSISVAPKGSPRPEKTQKGGSGEATDDAEWDGAAAMAAAGDSDDPAAAYKAICAGEKDVGEPSEAQHWALPHHREPGAAANAAGVANARARLEQTDDLTNESAARTHLFETHTLPTDTASDPEKAIEDALTLLAEIGIDGEDAAQIISKNVMPGLLHFLKQLDAKSVHARAEDDVKSIRSAVQSLTEVLSRFDAEAESGDGDEKSRTADPAESEEPSEVKDEQPGSDPLSVLARIEELEGS